MARSSRTTLVDSGRYSSYSPMLFIRSLFCSASCSRSLVLDAVSSALSAALVALPPGVFFPDLPFLSTVAAPSTFLLTAAPAPVRCPVTSRPIASTPTWCTLSKSAMASFADIQSFRCAKYAYASRTISIASAPAYSSCSVRGDDSSAESPLATPPFLSDFPAAVPPDAASRRALIPGGKTDPRPCRSACTATSRQASRAPQNSLSTAGSQSPTVSNFSRASFSTFDVSVRLEDVLASSADVSLAGEVRESR
mmetsp:Transcript_52135/g.110807  ORF Transcript_52135/g.110807 Transcript_52135/m.110807 type:complete len:252 (+) Transcript_52135:494-1249(+)